MTTVSAARASSSDMSLCNSFLKWLLAIEAAVGGGGASGTSSIPASGALPTNVEALMNDADEDLRDGDGREGERADEAPPPTPWREFIEAFLCSVGDAVRASRLMLLELRRKGRAGVLPFGDDGVLLRCEKFIVEGEEGCEDAGRAVVEAVVIERLFSAFDSEVSFLFIDGGSGAGGAVSPAAWFKYWSAMAFVAPRARGQLFTVEGLL
jgi:hypothetical protein